MAFSGSESEYELEEILETRKRGRVTEYKVRWKGFGEDEDSWEPERSLMKSAPDAVETFKKKGSAVQRKTPTSRAVRELKQENDLSLTPRGSGRSSRNNTSTTTTTTTMVTKLESFSDASDTEGGLVRRSTRTVTKSSSSSSGDSKSSTSSKPSLLARCKSCMGCVSCAKIRQELPFIVYLACLCLIAATFVYEKL